MRVPDDWVRLDEVESTQTEVSRLVKQGRTELILLAKHQHGGRGRFGRPWLSQRGESLTLSIAFGSYVGHPRPWLLGMACACAAAELLDCNIRWPNDLGLNGRKLGGILTDLFPDDHGHMVPCVGIGINVGQTEFPVEIADRATSLVQEGRAEPSIDQLASSFIEHLRTMPDPQQWTDLEPHWMPRDLTPGKSYRLPNGDVATAIRVGAGGELHCELRGEPRVVLAADSIFGKP
ncbi:MAG: biotin--[acetyl-CoA-carboxylase] ligase [Methanoregulaceae archaeon]|nr:biotin--[acetyl-CoA-carboxylase] ligase [Methanoregulaceae archaeon]